MEWQPIETAPAAELVQVTDGSTVAAGVFHLGAWLFWEGGIQIEDHGEETGVLNSWVNGYGPSHWAPLLPAPEAA